MSNIIIEGGNRLIGEINIQGAKNSTLPVLAATLLCHGESVIHNCPRLSDVDSAVKILTHLGCICNREGDAVTVDATALTGFEIPDELMREMRSSIVFLGAIAGRCGKAKLSSPGGCELGARPIDLHLTALKSMGVTIFEDHGYLDCTVENGLVGRTIDLALPSVGATENIMLAAVTAKGRTRIHNAAREPEICDLADFLNGAGARVYGAGSDTVVIDGVSRLHGAEHTVIPDRIVAATFMAATAITGGSVILKRVIPAHLRPMMNSFQEAGCEIEIEEGALRIMAPRRLSRISTVRTLAYPGFPTDAGPPVLAMTTLAKGTSMFVENIFENRYKYVNELCRLGAKVKVEGRVAVVEGVDLLSGAPVEATDLRGGAALIVAGLAANGVTQVGKIHHIDRGYDRLVENLKTLGASIKRE